MGQMRNRTSATLQSFREIGFQPVLISFLKLLYLLTVYGNLIMLGVLWKLPIQKKMLQLCNLIEMS